MPKVGDKHFDYTPEGISKAREYSAEVGIPAEFSSRYNVGGIVRRGDGDVDLVRTRGSGKAVRGCTRRVKKRDVVQ